MASSHPRIASDAFKLAACMYLQEEGFPDARPTPHIRKLSETLRNPGDISGLPVVAMVSAKRGIDFSTLLRTAADAAIPHGLPYVAICNRVGYPIAQSYAVVELQTLAELMRYYDPERDDEGEPAA